MGSHFVCPQLAHTLCGRGWKQPVGQTKLPGFGHYLLPDSVVKVMMLNTHKQSDSEDDWVPMSNAGGSVVYLPIEKTLAINYGENYVSQKMGDTEQYEYLFTVRVPSFMTRDGEADTIRSVWTFDGYNAKPQAIYRNGKAIPLQEIHENSITVVLDYPQTSTSSDNTTE